MVFKKMLKAFGVGGPSVDTVIANPECRPGELLTGEVRIAGGDSEAEIEHIALSLVTRVERGEGAGAAVEFHRAVVSGRFRLAAKEDRVIPFQVPLPWEAPITNVFGQHLHGMALGLRTELAVAKAVDKGDLDPVYIEPLPAQQAVLDAFGRLGFHFKSADLEAGRIHGVRQELPFFQEIEFFPPPAYAGRVNEVELTFVSNPGGVVVVLEADKRAGMFRAGGDAIGRISVSHEEALDTDWAEAISEWLDHVAQQRHSHLAPGYGHPGMHGNPYGHHGHRGHGSGMGGAVAGAAAGVVGGMILGEMMEDAFEGDEGGGEEEF